MLRSCSLTAIAFVLLFSGCSKNNSSDESFLYGTWVNDSNAGDTLRFMSKTGMNILRYNISFNTAMPAITDMEYTYKNGTLSLAIFTPGRPAQPFQKISSFTWVLPGKKFRVQGMQLFRIMSSSSTYLTYTKIN